MIVTRDRQVLLIKRGAPDGEGTWSTPGGPLQYGESPQQCALRVAQEAAGITLTNVVFRAITNDVFAAERKHSLTIWLEGAPVFGEATKQAPLEHAAIGWFFWDALPEPLYLPFEHLLTGQCDPAPWNFSEEETP